MAKIDENMSSIDIIKLNIKINAVKIVSLWLTTGLLFFQGGSMYRDFCNRMDKYEKYETAIKSNSNRIDSIEVWRKEVTAYYIPKQSNSNATH